jgi:predicted nucleotidyltransferase
MDPVKMIIDGVEYTITNEGLLDEESNIVFEYNEVGDAIDDEGNVVAEAHDMENAEVQSVDSVSKAAKSTKQAPARKGDKRGTGEVTMPKGPAGKIGAMYDKMKGLSKEDLDVAYGLLMREDFDDVEVDESAMDIDVNVDFTEDLNALVESEATLSEEFKAKTAIIFEAAIKSKVSEEINRLEAEYETSLAEESQAMQEALVDQVDGYLNYAVETWMAENELAVASGLRSEIAENFMKGFFDLCQENYIEVPESKVDLVDELAEQVEGLEGQLSNSIDDMIEMAQTIEGLQRKAIVSEHSDGLAVTQVEKLASLVEDLDFEDAESFSEKVRVCKESYFTKKVVEGDSTIAEETDGDVEKEISPIMDSYITAMRNINK